MFNKDKTLWIVLIIIAVFVIVSDICVLHSYGIPTGSKINPEKVYDLFFISFKDILSVALTIVIALVISSNLAKKNTINNSKVNFLYSQITDIRERFRDTSILCSSYTSENTNVDKHQLLLKISEVDSDIKVISSLLNQIENKQVALEIKKKEFFIFSDNWHSYTEIIKGEHWINRAYTDEEQKKMVLYLSKVSSFINVLLIKILENSSI